MSVKDVNIKNYTYYFLDDIINIKDFDPNNIKIDKKSYRNILICYIGYVMVKKRPENLQCKSFVPYFW